MSIKTIWTDIINFLEGHEATVAADAKQLLTDSQPVLTILLKEGASDIVAIFQKLRQEREAGANWTQLFIDGVAQAQIDLGELVATFTSQELGVLQNWAEGLLQATGLIPAPAAVSGTAPAIQTSAPNA